MDRIMEMGVEGAVIRFLVGDGNCAFGAVPSSWFRLRRPDKSGLVLGSADGGEVG